MNKLSRGEVLPHRSGAVEACMSAIDAPERTL